MVSDRIRAMGAVHWIVLFALILAAWLALFAMSIPSDLRIAARVYGADFWASLCIVTPDAAGLAPYIFISGESRQSGGRHHCP